jgi:ZIP family zinc transporter
VIEGVTIGVGTAIQPGVGILIAIAIAIDNIAEALSIGEFIRAEQSREKTLPVKRVLGWTGLVGVSLFVPALLGWWFLCGLPQPVLGFLFATGAGGMFYLTITDLIPEAEERHYQQSAAIAVGGGFMVIFVLSKFL